MSKSVIQMFNELFARVDALEKRLAAPQVMPTALVTDTTPSVASPVGPVTPAVSARPMCPKCGEKPNYFFHVQYCKGKQKEKDAENTVRRRDQGTP